MLLENVLSGVALSVFISNIDGQSERKFATDIISNIWCGKKSYVDIITCNTDVYIEHAGFLNQQYLSLSTCIATIHNARGEFYNN